MDIEAEDSLRLDVRFPRLLSNALIVYRLTPRFKEPARCVGEFAGLSYHVKPM